jgi:hypothetical protein
LICNKFIFWIKPKLLHFKPEVDKSWVLSIWYSRSTQMSIVTVGESSFFFLHFPLKQLLIYNAYCVFEYRLLNYSTINILKCYLLSEILPTSALNSQILTDSLFYYYWYLRKVFMRSPKWFPRKLVFWLSWKIAKMDILHYNNQAAR